MITNFIYILIALILIFVFIIAVRAVNLGIKAKTENSIEKDNILLKENINIGEEILQIKKLHDEGVLTKDEFKKAKEKILSS